MNNWDTTKELILKKLEETNRTYRTLSFSGRDRIFTIEFNTGEKYEIPYEGLKELNL